MKISDGPLSGLLIVEPDCFEDARGYFFESWNRKKYEEYVFPQNFVQDNISYSREGVLRGLHFQNPNAQGKLVTVLEGEVFDVAVDLRIRSATYKQWFGAKLSSKNGRQIYIPSGFAHGFIVTSKEALFFYKCTEYYDPASEKTLLWNDPDLLIDWPTRNPIMSVKDSQGSKLRELTNALYQ